MFLIAVMFFRCCSFFGVGVVCFRCLCLCVFELDVCFDCIRCRVLCVCVLVYVLCFVLLCLCVVVFRVPLRVGFAYVFVAFCASCVLLFVVCVVVGIVAGFAFGGA